MIQIRFDTSGFTGRLDRLAVDAVNNAIRRGRDAADQIVADARTKWPIGRERTGAEEGRPRSRDLFEIEERIDAEHLRVIVRNKAPYAYKIDTTQNGVSGNPWQVLVVKPMKAASRKLAADIAEDIRRGGG